MKSSLSSFGCFLMPDQPDLRNKEPYSVRRFWLDWFVIIFTVWFFVYAITNSTTMSVLLMMAIPFLAVYQGAVGMLNYRYHFGTPPFPRNPAHGVVVVNPKDLKEKDSIQYGSYQKEQHGNGCDSGCQCEGGLRWRRGGPLSVEEGRVLETALNDDNPIRILVIGDSLALGLGTDMSCMPLLPETLAKSISKRMGGKAVYWTGYGGEGAATSWTLNELATRRQQSNKNKIEQIDNDDIAPNLKRDSLSEYSPTTVMTESSSMSSNNDSDEVQNSNNNNNYNTENDSLIGRIVEQNNNKKTTKDKKTSMKNNNRKYFWNNNKRTNNDNTTTCKNIVNEDKFGKWKEKLQNFRRGFEEDISGPYDYVFIFAGGNDAKSAFIPVYVKTKKSDATKKKALFDEFESILDQLGPKMYDTNLRKIDDEEEDCCSNNNSKATTTTTKKSKSSPLVVFPMMPTRLIPAFQSYPLLWAAIPLIGIIENNKRRLQKKYPRHVRSVDAPQSQDATSYESQNGLLWHRRTTEDTLLCLRDVTSRQCHQTTLAMEEHVRNKGTIHCNKGIFESRKFKNTSEEMIDMINAPQPPLSKLDGGGKGCNIVSVDRVHPNDEGYDFWARHISEELFSEQEQTITSYNTM